MNNDLNNKQIMAINLQKLLKENSVTRADLSRAIAVPYTTITDWIKAKTYPRIDNIERIANFFGVEKSYLVENQSLPQSVLQALKPVPKTKTIPHLESVICGKPVFADYECSYVDGPIKADFAVTAQDDSMVGARIFDQDIVFCSAQEIVNNGEIACMIIGDKVSLKRFFYYREKKLIILKPENRAYEDQIYTESEIGQVKVIGKAVAFQSVLN